MMDIEYIQYTLLVIYNILVLLPVCIGGYLLRKLKIKNKLVRTLKLFYIIIITHSIIALIVEQIVSLNIFTGFAQYWETVQNIMNIYGIFSAYIFTPLILFANIILIVTVYKYKESVKNEGDFND